MIKEEKGRNLIAKTIKQPNKLTRQLKNFISKTYSPISKEKCKIFKKEKQVILLSYFFISIFESKPNFSLKLNKNSIELGKSKNVS